MIESPLCLSLRVSTTKQHFCYSIIESIPIKLKDERNPILLVSSNALPSAGSAPLLTFIKWIFRDLSCSQILKPDPYPFLNISIFLSIDRQKDIDLYLDLSPYLSKLRKNQYLKGVTNGRFSPCPRHCSPTMPPGRKGPSLSFFNRSDQDKWVCFVLLSTQFSVFVRDHVGRKVVCCRGAAVKRRFPPFH